MSYFWKASSSDGAFIDRSKEDFKTEKEAYEDMRDAALEKMKWNTEYDEDFHDVKVIPYRVVFHKTKIVHDSYSGVYTYEIFGFEDKEDTDNKETEKERSKPMGEIKWDDRDGYYFVSNKGVEYDLEQGSAIKGVTSSDIIYVTVRADSSTDEIAGDLDYLFVGWFFGASCLEESPDYRKDAIDILNRITSNWEEKHKEIVEYFVKKNEEKKKKKYKVFAKVTTYNYLEVEAKDEEEARQIAEDADGGEFTECPDADWEITSVILE